MEETRLVDGIYASSVFPYAVVEIKGTVGYFKYLAQFDHPDLELEHGMKIAYTYGQFSDTSPEVEEKTGAKKSLCIMPIASLFFYGHVSFVNKNCIAEKSSNICTGWYSDPYPRFINADLQH